MDFQFILFSVIKIIAICIIFAMSLGGLLTWVERKQSAIIQDRIGPNRASILGVRIFGLFHPVADMIKVFTKEDFVPDNANKFIFFIAPILSLCPPLIVLCVVPFGPGDYFQISSLSVGILFVFAISSLGVYGACLAGWSSNNKFSLLGALRTSSQMLSYEVIMGLNLMGVFMVFESIDLQKMVIEQGELIWGFLPKWGIIVQPLGFILFLTAAIAESKRTPFDLPEGESEIVAGYHTEYSAMRFALFFLSEFIEVVVISAIAGVVFLGGWQIPFLYPAGNGGGIITILQILSFIIKVCFLCWFQLMIRWTLPRFRYDQVMRLCWKYLLPLSLLNIFATAIVLLLIEG